MKVCSKCGLEKGEVDFSKNVNKKDGLQAWCKDCIKSYEQSRKGERHDYHKRYQELHREEISRQKKSYYSNRAKFVEGLKQSCAKCGDNRKYVIQFHHINPDEKLFTIGTLEKKSESLILEEVKKCVCLCANCHSEFHWFYGKNPEKPVEMLEEYLGKRIVGLSGGENG